MPIEIKELYIKAVVSDSKKQTDTRTSAIDISKIKKEVVKECVEKVLRVLKEKNER